MALTYTPPAELGSQCPDFNLPSVQKTQISRDQAFLDKGLVVLFICSHCPYVKAIEDRIVQLGTWLQEKQIGCVGICSNDPSDYPEDHPDELLKRWQQKNYSFEYLVDESQQIAKDFTAVCTPDIFLFDSEQKLYYRGRLDDSWKDTSQVTAEDLKQAAEALLAGNPPPSNQIPSMGCSIKWKQEN